jgi:hypothetical protein
METETEFLSRLGLEGNPFLHWDADQEDRLPDYFVPPPYFASVVGDPAHPASTVVFAPRGGGKSAQRRIVETSCDPDRVLCVTHDTFPFAASKRPKEIRLDDHLSKIIRDVLVAVIARLAMLEGLRDRLSPAERTSLQMMATLYLDDVTRVELQSSLNALKNLSQKAVEFYNKLSWAYNALGRSALQAVGMPAPALPDLKDMGQEPQRNPVADVQALGRLANAVGLDAVYVLVDKVDETASTSNDAAAAYALVGPLLQDLRILSLRPFCFKFFLPDTLTEYHAEKARPDRVQQFALRWSSLEVSQMLSRRLAAYSGGRLTSLGQILADDSNLRWFVDHYFIRFAEGSPRDMVRILNRILAEQMRLEPNSSRLTVVPVVQGMDAFCAERAHEVVSPSILSELRRMKRVDFTISETSGDVFKVSGQAARAKIQNWERAGAVRRLPDKSGARRPVHHYGVADIRVGRQMCRDGNLLDFIRHKVRTCPRCDATLLRDWEEDSEQICSCGERVANPQ